MSLLRPFSGSTAILIVLGMLVPANAFAEGELSLVLEPHCTEPDRAACAQFDVADPAHLMTQTLAIGELIDIDVVLTNAQGKGVKKIRSWLKYDQSILEPRSVELTPIVAEPLPGEQSVNGDLGIIKIGGNVNDGISSDRVAVARVTFRIIRSEQNTEISFVGFHEDGILETAVNGSPEAVDHGGLTEPPCVGGLICQKKIVPLLKFNPSALTVLLQVTHDAAVETAVAAEAPPIETEPVAEVPAMPEPSPVQNEASSFPLLQVQNVRVTSQNRDIFLGWQELRSSELAGYNVYYGTVSGKYIQRRSLPANSTSLMLRDLEPGTTYFMAVRGYNNTNQETVFSQEVSVAVGNPDSSSAPLIGGVEELPPVEGNPIENHNGTEINGTTGMSDTILYSLLLCAFIGTVLAAHRQLSMLRLQTTHAV